jgi:hypothetical protein
MTFRPLPFVVISLLSGCTIGGDKGGIIPPKGALERATRDARRQLDLDTANVIDRIADRLEHGEILNVDDVHETIRNSGASNHRKDFKKVDEMLGGAAEYGRFGLRQVKCFREMAAGYRSNGGQTR